MHKTMPLYGLALWLLTGIALAGEAHTLNLADGTEMSVALYPAEDAGKGGDEGNLAVLWLPSEHGLTPGLDRVATALSRQGVDVWVADPYTTWFLPVATSSLAKFRREPLAELVGRLHAQTDKRVVVVSNDRASRVALEVARSAQQAHATNLAGVVLISPNLYRQTPQPGEPAQFEPIAAATNLPVFLMVADNSTLKLRLAAIANEFGKGGSRAYVQVLPDVRDRFFFRPDALSNEDATANRLPVLLRQAMGMLEHEAVPERAAALHESGDVLAESRTQTLAPYTGSLTPPSFSRVDLDGKRHTLDDYRGEVVLLNFWASWCPPCIHEMPSMARLQRQFANRPFHILAVNLGQSRAEVEQFLETTPVNFPIFLDETKVEPTRWQVFAFPTSYLIDAEGRIRYGVAGGLEWDSAAVVDAVSGLLAEAGRPVH